MLAFVVHTGAEEVSGRPAGYDNCGGGLERAFVSGTLANSYKDKDILKGYRHSDAAAVTALNADGKDDAYELLAKGIGAYNGGNGFTSGRSWPDVLKETTPPPPKTFTNKNGYCVSCKYSIEVRNGKYGLPYRTYIWKGGEGVDVNKDGKIEDIEANPEAMPPVVGVVEKTVPWCFVFGEREWIDGKLWEDVKNAADYLDKAGRRKTPVGQISCE